MTVSVRFEHFDWLQHSGTISSVDHTAGTSVPPQLTCTVLGGILVAATVQQALHEAARVVGVYPVVPSGGGHQ